MKSIKRGIAVLLAALLFIPDMPVRAADSVAGAASDVVQYNTGNGICTVTTVLEEEKVTTDPAQTEEPENPELPESPAEETVTGSAVEEKSTEDDAKEENVSDGMEPAADDYFAEDGSYIIQIPEVDPFFPYEVQFTYNGTVSNEWFMTPEDSVEIGGHTFYVSAEFSGTVVTQMSFDVAGDTVIVYPEEKEFPENGMTGYSLLPLERKSLSVDLTGYTPMELSMVKISTIFTGEREFTDTDKIMWSYISTGDDYTVSTSGDTIDMNRYSSYQMIVGSDDQLDTSNIRYIVYVTKTSMTDWLIADVYRENISGKRTKVIPSSYSVESSYIDVYIPISGVINSDEVYVSLKLNEVKFPSPKFDHIKVYEGAFGTLEDAIAGNEITDQVWEADVSQSGNGYLIELPSLDYSKYSYITLVVFDADGNATGFRTVQLYVYFDSTISRWLVPSVSIQDADGNRTEMTVSGYNYDNYGDMGYEGIYIPINELSHTNAIYVGLEAGNSIPSGMEFDHLKVYEGNFTTLEDITAEKEITKQIWEPDMNQDNGGYLVERAREDSLFAFFYITLVAFDAEDNVVWFQPTEIYILSIYGGVVDYSLEDEDGNNVTYRSNFIYENSIQIIKHYLNYGYKADAEYFQRFYYENAYNVRENEAVLHAYVGNYTDVAAAEAAGAKDIKDDLFGSTGYKANYSKMVYFTIFVKVYETEEGEPIIAVYHYGVLAEEREEPASSLSSVTSLNFTGLKDAEGKNVNCYIVGTQEDSYAEFNYLTILVDKDTDLANLAPVFQVHEVANLYTTGSSTPEESGKSLHNFSNGPLQYTVSAQDGKNSKNYWLQIVQAVDDGELLYVNSLADPDANTNGIQSTREVMLDSYHENVHDILLVNMGSNVITGAAVELVSDVLELDDYWTLKGEFSLSGFDGLERKDYYGELENMAKIRLRVKDGVAEGADISGTLTVKSSTKDLIIFNLTGTIGNPCITTTDIPAAVKYVPYGTMIQNNNKYSWNTVSYSVYEGELPEGMILKPNGELYGVPKETGEFTFWVKMENSGGYYSFTSSFKEFTLEVKENTNENVDSATDAGYDVMTRIQNLYVGDKRQNELFVSAGTFEELVDVYLDGEKLVEGTDYTAESGSTRITIMAETLDEGLDEGTHTLGVEFRDKEDSLKKAAQNFDVVKRSSTGGNTGGSSADIVTTPEPTATVIPEPTATPTPEPTVTAVPTPEPTATPKPTATLTPTSTPAPTVTPKPLKEPDKGVPFVKDDEETAGWNAIKEQLEKVSDGEVIVVDMNSSSVIPGEVIKEIAGRDVTVQLVMDQDITWEINGNSVTLDNIADIDLEVLIGLDANEIPVEIVNSITGECYYTNLTLAYEGEFGFTAVLCINLGKKNAGLYANLFYYREVSGELEFICADQIDKEGTARLSFTHASDYIIVIDDKVMDENSPEEKTEDGSSTSTIDKDLPRTALKESVWFLFTGMLIMLAGGMVLWIAYDKKGTRISDIRSK